MPSWFGWKMFPIHHFDNYHLIKHFTEWKPQNPMLTFFSLHRMWQWTDFEALDLWNVRPGTPWSIFWDVESAALQPYRWIGILRAAKEEEPNQWLAIGRSFWLTDSHNSFFFFNHMSLSDRTFFNFRAATFSLTFLNIPRFVDHRFRGFKVVKSSARQQHSNDFCMQSEVESVSHRQI